MEHGDSTDSRVERYLAFRTCFALERIAASLETLAWVALAVYVAWLLEQFFFEGKHQ